MSSQLNLLTDLVSLTELPNELWVSLARHIAILPIPALQQVFDLLVESAPAIDASRLTYQTGIKVFSTIKRGLQARIVRLLQEQHSTWTTRRRLNSLYETLCQTVQDAKASNEALKPLLLASILSSLRIKDATFITDGLIDSVEKSLVQGWNGYLQSGVDFATYSELPSWLAAESLVDVKPTLLPKLPIQPLLDICSNSISKALDDGNFLDKEDPKKDIVQLMEQPAYPLLGRHSRLLGKLIESVSPEDLTSVNETLQRLCGITSRLHSIAAATSKWRNASKSELSSWTLLKATLFSQTMIFQSVLRLIYTSSIPRTATLPLVRTGLGIFANLYFVAEEFGSVGFVTFQAVWKGMLRCLISGGASELESFLDEVQPKGEGEEKVLLADEVFWSICGESLIGDVSEPYVKQVMLPRIRPQTTDSREAVFASAHSIVLSLLRTGRHCAVEVIPWYIHLLIKREDLFQSKQLMIAFSTTVAAASKADDGLAWYCLEQVFDAIHGRNNPLLAPAPEVQDRLFTLVIAQCSNVNLILLDKLLAEIYVVLRDWQSKGHKKVLFGIINQETEPTRKAIMLDFWISKGLGDDL